MVQTHQECSIYVIYVIKGMDVYVLNKIHRVSSYIMQFNLKHISITIHVNRHSNNERFKLQ